jgi:excisionase family DNA binding protein
MQLIINKLNEILEFVRKTNTSRYIDINELTEYANVSKSTIRRNVTSGTLKASKSTGKLLFKVDDVEAWLNN